MYYIDLGYDFVDDECITLEFNSISDANKIANEVFKRTGEVLAITDTQQDIIL